MTTLNQAAYNILNQLRGGRSTNNEYLSLEQIKYWIKYYRALLIRRDEERYSRVEGLSQTIVVPFTSNVTYATDGQTLPTPGANVPANVAESDDAIPTLVRLKQMPAILGVTIEDSLSQVPYIDYRRSMWNQYDRYTSASRRCWLRENKLYVSGWDLTGVVTPTVHLTGIFEDPEAAYNFEAPATPWDDNVNEFPLTADLLQQVTQSIIGGEGQIMLQTPSDHTLDNLPDQQAE